MENPTPSAIRQAINPWHHLEKYIHFYKNGGN